MSKLLEKIKKLKALSESSNENEAATALRAMRALMDKTGITEKDLLISNLKETESRLKAGHNIPDWLNVIMEAVCELFECAVYFDLINRRSGNEMIIHFVGFHPNEEIAQYTFDILHEKILRARQEKYQSLPKWWEYVVRKEQADSYCLGWAMAVYGQIESMVPDTDTRMQEFGIVPVQEAKAKVKDITEGRVQKVEKSPMHSASYQQGYIDGSLVQVNKGINKEGQKMLN